MHTTSNPYAARLRSHRYFSASLQPLYVFTVPLYVIAVPLYVIAVEAAISLRFKTHPISQGLKK